MRIGGFIKISQGSYYKYNTSTWIETSVGGILECLKTITPELYNSIVNQDYDEDGYLNLTDLTFELYSTEEVFKNIILNKFIDNKYFVPEVNEDDGFDIFNSDNEQNFKLSKEQLKKNIGVFVLCRFKNTMGIETNSDNIGAKFNYNKIFCYYNKNLKLNNESLQIASNIIKKNFQNNLDAFTSLNPDIEKFTVDN